jgi:hypothetical protein
VKGDEWQKLHCDLNWKQHIFILLKACPTVFFQIHILDGSLFLMNINTFRITYALPTYLCKVKRRNNIDQSYVYVDNLSFLSDKCGNFLQYLQYISWAFSSKTTQGNLSIHEFWNVLVRFSLPYLRSLFLGRLWRECSRNVLQVL